MAAVRATTTTPDRLTTLAQAFADAHRHRLRYHRWERTWFVYDAATRDWLPDRDRAMTRHVGDWLHQRARLRLAAAVRRVSRQSSGRRSAHSTLPGRRQTIVGINGSMVNGTPAIRPAPGDAPGVRPSHSSSVRESGAGR
jgi:hypothetical protein